MKSIKCFFIGRSVIFISFSLRAPYRKEFEKCFMRKIVDFLLPSSQENGGKCKKNSWFQHKISRSRHHSTLNDCTHGQHHSIINWMKLSQFGQRNKKFLHVLQVRLTIYLIHVSDIGGAQAPNQLFGRSKNSTKLIMAIINFPPRSLIFHSGCRQTWAEINLKVFGNNIINVCNQQVAYHLPTLLIADNVANYRCYCC